MIPKPPGHVAIVADGATLSAFCQRMREREWIAVDTEFLRESTYYPKLCLVQIADADEIALIDVLAIDELAPLADLLADADVLKIFHSAEQDLEVLRHRLGVVPAPLFDSQVAAPLVGLDDQMGYARLIKALLDIELPKTHTRTDWSRRPLPDGALEYAADDVRYLAVAYEMLVDKLSAADRLAWLAADFQRLADPARFDVDPALAWRRVKAWHRIDPAAQQVLAELAAWREREAMTSDRPRKWIVGDDVIMEIAQRQPTDAAALAAINGLADKTATRHARALLECVEKGRARPAEILAEHGGPPTPAEKKQTKAGMDALAESAATAGIATSAIASRHEIAAIVAGERDLRLLSGWRAEVAGNAVVAAVEAEQSR